MVERPSTVEAMVRCMSNNKRQQTMAKIERERAVKEKRARKLEKKQAAAMERKARAAGLPFPAPDDVA